jgi:hypothetical protein
MRRPTKGAGAGPGLDTEAGLHAAAMTYLERHVTSRAHLRRLLLRKAVRAPGDEADREALAPIV